MKNLGIIIPAYNPTKDLIPLVEGLLKEDNIDVIVINDGSGIHCKEIFERLPKEIIYLEHVINKGKGEALKTGFKYVIENLDCYGVVTADADGQHILEDILKVAEEMRENLDKLILGSRLDIEEMLPRSKFGNTLTRKVFHLVTGVRVFDTQTGLRGIPYRYLEIFSEISGERYEYEINVLIYAAKKKIEISEIGIHTIYIDNNSASSFNPIKDSIKIYRCLLNNFKKIKGILYVISGLITVLIYMIANNMLNFIMFGITKNSEASALVSMVLALTTSTIINFYMNKYIVFSNKKKDLFLFMQYCTLMAVNLIAYGKFTEMLTNSDFYTNILKLSIIIVMFFINYFIQNYLMFYKKTK